MAVPKEKKMPRVIDDENAYPSGDQPPESEETEDTGYAEGSEETGKETAAKDTDKSKDTGKDKGKEKDKGDDWETRYKNLEKKLGEQGKQVGDLKKQNKELETQLKSVQESDKGRAEKDKEAPGFADQIETLKTDLEQGNIDLEEYTTKTTRLVADMVKTEADQRSKSAVQEALNQRDQDAVVQKFMKDNPDFQELKESGALQEIQSEYPGLHDDFSAYFEHQRRQAEQTGYDRGRQEMEELSKGDEGTDKVLKKPGSAIRNQNPQKVSGEADIKNSMAQTLEKIRGSG